MNQNDNNWHVVYKSNNFFIRIVGERFLLKVNELLGTIGSEKKRGVEIGCGEAHLLDYLLQKKTINSSVVALDLNPSDLEFAQSRYPYFCYVQGNAEFAPLRDKMFDFVIVLEVLEHVENPRKVLGEILRIAKPGASILISVPNEPYFYLANLLRGKYVGRFGKTPNHLSFWTVSQFSQMLDDYFIIDEKHCFSVFPWQLYLCRPRTSNDEK